jgi:hypothetical protein
MDTPWEEPTTQRGHWHGFGLFEDTSRFFWVDDRCNFRFHTPPHYSTGKSPTYEDDEDDDKVLGFRMQHHHRDPWQAKEIPMS